MTDNLCRRAENIPTTLFADVLGDHGHLACVVSPAIQGLTPEVPRRAGRAFTVAGGPSMPGDAGPDLLKARAIDRMAEGDIAVWSGGDVSDVCLFGGLLAAAMRVRGVRGAVVDGGFRDVEDIDPQAFPVYARYRTPRASTGVWRVRAVDEPVTLTGTLGGTVEISPGDIVVADGNGVVVIPDSAAEQVVAACEAHQAKEHGIRVRIEAVESVEKLLIEYGRI
jgi:regulator of RNase E activity RraA